MYRSKPATMPTIARIRNSTPKRLPAPRRFGPGSAAGFTPPPRHACCRLRSPAMGYSTASLFFLFPVHRRRRELAEQVAGRWRDVRSQAQRRRAPLEVVHRVERQRECALLVWIGERAEGRRVQALVRVIPVFLFQIRRLAIQISCPDEDERLALGVTHLHTQKVAVHAYGIDPDLLVGIDRERLAGEVRVGIVGQLDGAPG